MCENDKGLPNAQNISLKNELDFPTSFSVWRLKARSNECKENKEMKYFLYF